MSYHQGGHIRRKRFLALSLFRKFAKILILRGNAVGKTPMLVVYPLPDKGRYRYIDNGVGVDCLFQNWAFGDASK